MRHVLISVLIFAVLLVFSIWSCVAVQNAATPVVRLLTAAQKSIAAEDFKNAGKFAEMANEAWKKNETLFGILLRHDETDEVMRHFAALQKNAETEDRDDFSSTCAELLCQLSHISSMQIPSLENIL